MTKSSLLDRMVANRACLTAFVVALIACKLAVVAWMHFGGGQ